jgi:hypothetical protein
VLAKKKGQILQCSNCGISIYKTNAIINRNTSGCLYCSQSCSTAANNKKHRIGSKNPNWVGGQASYRLAAFRCYTQQCAICEYDVVEALQVHHIDGNRKNNDFNNLIVLCPTHHVEAHLNMINEDEMVLKRDNLIRSVFV